MIYRYCTERHNLNWLEYLVSNIGIKAFAEYNVNFNDNLDYKGRSAGDNYYKFGLD
jgi:hypothetical protein